MAKYHINPKTGNPGVCRAEKQCRFGGAETHYPSPENARAAYELSMAPVVKAEAAAVKDGAHRSEADDAYRALLAHAGTPEPHIESVMSTLQAEDIEYGIEDAVRKLARRSGSERGWQAVMGDVNRTRRNIDRYNQLLRDEVCLDEDLKDHALSVAGKRAKAAAWGRAFENNVAIDADLANDFNEIWEGRAQGKSKAELIAEGQDLQTLHVNLREGRVKPSSVVGTGLRDPRRAAKEYVDKRLSEIGRAIKTEGRSEAVNVSNALHVAAKRNRP